MKLELTTPYTGTVVSVANAATQVFGDATYDSTKLTRDINAAVRRAINYCERSFLDETWTLTLDTFPGVIYLPMGEVSSVTSVKYWDSDSQNTLVEGTDYRVQHNRVYPIDSWPTDLDSDRLGAVEVIYVAGEGSSLTASKHDDFVTAVLLDVGDYYENRQTHSAEELYRNPAYQMLLDPYKIYFDFYSHNA
jgi:uncharacterized phiE125 gp8 family phage protein